MQLPLVFLVLLVATAAAERHDLESRVHYGVQVGSFRDYDQALALVAALEDRGYGAYSEFFMLDDLQYVRVRVGCFEDAEAAHEVAGLLLFGSSDEAVVVALEDLPEQPCLRRELGFLAPERWGVAAEAAEGVVFWTEIGELRGYVFFGGEGWQVLQAESVIQEGNTIEVSLPGGGREPLAPRPAAGVPALFEGASDPERIVARGTGNPAFTQVLAGGRLLWRSPRAAVVHSGDAVFSLELKEAR